MESNFHSGFGSLLGAFATFSYLYLKRRWDTRPGSNGKLDTAKIDQLTGMKGELNEKEGVFTVRAPRNDLQVTAAGVKMNPRWA